MEQPGGHGGTQAEVEADRRWQEERIHAIYDTWNSEDIVAASANWTDDMIYIDPPDLPDAGVWHGPVQFAARMQEMAALLGHMTFEVREIHWAGGEAVLRLDMTLHGSGSGVALPGEAGHIVILEDGKLKRLAAFLSWDACHEAAGLRR